MSDAGLNLADRLRVLRRDALRQLAARNGVDAGLLELAAHVGTVLGALDAEVVKAVPPEPGDRAVVTDDNLQIKVVVYSADRQAAAAVLSPPAAIRLAGQLISSAVRRL